MKKINIINVNNQAIEVDAIRYFKNNENKYFVYSLNELDGMGYIRLYVTKIVMEENQVQGINIADETEWTTVKDVIKQIIRENRDGSPVTVTDLALVSLANGFIKETRVFKLQSNLVTLLAENQNDTAEGSDNIPATSVEVGPITEPAIEQPTVEVEQPVAPTPVATQPVEGSTPTVPVVDWQQKIDELQSKIAELESKITKIKAILGE